MDKLTKEGEIERVEDQGYSRVFPAGTESGDRLLLSLVRRKTDHTIISCLLREKGVSQQRLTNLTGLSKSTVSEHLAILARLGIVRTRGGEERRVFELTDPARANQMMNVHPPLLKKATSRFIDLWDF